jgi:hypothetical protein
MRIFPIDYSLFKSEFILGQDKTLHSHEVHKGTLEGGAYKRYWYAKDTRSLERACLSLLSNEMFRLINRQKQPQTLLAKDDENTRFFLLSEELEYGKYRPMSDIAYTEQGLATILITSVWLNEVDLKFDNIVKNKECNAVAKIDSDCCFYSLLDQSTAMRVNFDPTPILIARLPFPESYPAYNWLGFLSENETYDARRYGDASSLRSPEFCEELNQALLRIILMPDCYIHALVETFLVRAQYDQVSSFLIERRDLIRHAALLNTSFKAYLKSPEASSDAGVYLLALEAFQSHRVTILSPGKRYMFGAEFTARCHELGLSACPSPLSFDKENAPNMAASPLPSRASPSATQRFYDSVTNFFGGRLSITAIHHPQVKPTHSGASASLMS